MLSTALIFAGIEIIVILYQSQSSPFASIFHRFLLCYHHLHYRFRNRSLCSSALSKIRSIVFHPDPSMPCLHLAFLLVIAWAFFYSGTKCIDQWYEDCLHNSTHCGNTSISYPFGLGNHGCGDPHFQLYCVKNKPVLSINTKNYSILEPNYLGLYNANHAITIVNEKLLQQKCDLSNDYDDLWSNAYFNITQEYTHNLILLQCDETPPFPSFRKLNCSSSWYYGWTLPTNWDTFCKLHSKLPVTVDRSDLSLLPPNFLHRGVQIEWYTNESRDQSCIDCESTMGICGYDFLDPQQPFVCICEDAPHLKNCDDGGVIHRSKSRQSRRGIIIIGSCVVGVAVIAVALLILTCYLRRRKPPTNRRLARVIKVIGMQPVNSRMSVCKVEKFLEDYAYEMPARYSYTQLKRITNNFSHKLGEGGFGVVYKGALSNGTLVAAKLLDRSRHGEKQFMNEVGTIGRIHHVHLVRLLGFCFEGSRAALLYEYMPNGSLEKFIFPGYEDTSHTLNWVRLHSIALGAARGIAYLHMDCEKRIIHLDIKPHNILLDENLSPKVSDFGLAKLYSKTNDHISMTAARGTPGYAALEMWSRNFGPVTDKSDVYSFGMLLLEMVGGRKNMDMGLGISNSQFYFPEWIFRHLHGGELCKLRGVSCGSAEDEEIATRMSKVGLWCIQSKPSDRPSMNRVVQMLQGNGDAVDDPPAPFDISYSAAPEAPLLFDSTSGEYSPSNEIKEIR